MLSSILVLYYKVRCGAAKSSKWLRAEDEYRNTVAIPWLFWNVHIIGRVLSTHLSHYPLTDSEKLSTLWAFLLPRVQFLAILRALG